MTNFDDTLWRHLVDEHGADRVELPTPKASKHRIGRSRRAPAGQDSPRSPPPRCWY